MRNATLCLVLAALAVVAAGADVEPAVRQAVLDSDIETLRSRGIPVLDELVLLYETMSTTQERAAVARAFYGLGWQSQSAKRVLMRDLDTADPRLKIDVQWALGRVSADPEVVDRLFAAMDHDADPLVRDKAGCAIANDQIHLDPRARLAMLRRVVDRLESESVESRSLAIRILQTQTGQTKGFLHIAPPEARAVAVARWRAWLAEYERSL